MDAEKIHVAFDRWEEFQELQLLGRGSSEVLEVAAAIAAFWDSVAMGKDARRVFESRITEFFPSNYPFAADDGKSDDGDFYRVAMIAAHVLLTAVELEKEAKVPVKVRG